VRTTLSLDEDVYRKLKSEVRRTGRPFKELVNDLLRRGLSQKQASPPRSFRIDARDMGLREGIDLSNIHQVLNDLDGATHR
jgi:hypothetical protein